jgi:hypothetical protein
MVVGVFEVYELERLDYTEAYLIARTDATSGRELISFHRRSTDRHRWDAHRALPAALSQSPRPDLGDQHTA